MIKPGKPSKAVKSTAAATPSPVRRGLPFFLLAFAMVGGLFLFYRYVYLPSEVVTAFNRVSVSDIDPQGGHVPKQVLDYFEIAYPHVVKALADPDEKKAAAAYVTLFLGFQEHEKLLAAFRASRLGPENFDEATFRAALLVEMVTRPGEASALGLSEPFTIAYLKWKLENRDGPFQVHRHFKGNALEELVALSGSEAVPFLMTLLEDSRTPSELMPVISVRIARYASEARVLEKAWQACQAQRFRPVAFLATLSRHQPQGKIRPIMQAAFATGDPALEGVAISFYLKNFDRDAASVIGGLLKTAATPRGIRLQISQAILNTGKPWALDFLIEGMSAWPPAVQTNLLDDLFPARHRWDAFFSFLLRLGQAKDASVRQAALFKWVQLEGERAFKPFGRCVETPQPQPGKLTPPAKGLLSKEPAWRRDWLKLAQGAVRSIESAGLVSKFLPQIDTALKAGLDYVNVTRSGSDNAPALREGLCRFVGRTVYRHGSVLNITPHAWSILYDRASDEDEISDVKIEAAFWLVLSGRLDPVLNRVLADALELGPKRRAIACAHALLRAGDRKAGERVAGWWASKNAIEKHLAFCEIPRLPPPIMGHAVGPLLAATKGAGPVMKNTVANGIAIALCVPQSEAVTKARAFLDGPGPEGIVTHWAAVAAVPVEPETGPDALVALADRAHDPKTSLESARACFFLLRRFTGTQFGFDPWIVKGMHQTEIARRWKKWVEVNRERLVWDGGVGQFLVR